MRIKQCSISRSLAHVNAWRFVLEINDCTFDGYFDDDFGHFLTMIKECAKFFAVKHNLLRVKDAGLTRQVMPGDGSGMILPGDKAQ